ncbi:flagellar hook-length control protein FliK [Clostridium tyrobutyricum]|uniref:flagellar hook-length control protein FliK n=1 Tax=Clostridium tyrobutyricum TaxID=1519 RepID=UPI001C3849C5|nr:flagellar hook-length control protein FliK [Clostridium tyrobutyricum]MBV4426938.1 flagellar hook-length control protein FliK [Clostridium tyrobutyricum]MBV4442094.1 flagellar hook-length control protein FliK [Clostridium tyrobutyricum]
MDVNTVNVKVENPYLNSSKSDIGNINTVHDDSFSKMVKKSVDAAKDNSNSNSNINIGKTKVDTTKQDNIDKEVPKKEESRQEDSKIESYLKKAGFTDEEIKNIKEKIDNNQISEGSIYDMLSLLFGNNADIDIQSNDFLNIISQELSSKILNNSFSGDTSSIKDIINTVVDTKLNFLKDVLDTSNQGKQVLEKISEKVSEKVSANIMAHLSQSQAAGNKNIIGETDLKTQIYMELINKLNLKPESTSMNNSNTQNSNITDNKLLQFSNSDTSILKSVNTDSITQLNDSENQNNGTSDNNSNKDTDVLNKILNSGESNNKIDKTVNFMTQFNNINNKKTVPTENSLENLNINKNSFTEDIIKSVKYMEINNVKDMTVKISPKELGNITINLVMEEGKMKAVITASNKDAYNILNSNIQDLSNKFQNSEIKIQNFSLNLYHEDTTFFKEEGKNRQDHGSSKQNRTLNIDSISDEDKILQQDDYSENNVDMLA